MLDADLAGRTRLKRQLHRHQHRVQPSRQHNGQHLRHHPIAARVAQQPSAQLLQRLGHVGEWRAVPQCAGLPLQQRNVVLPVIPCLASVAEPIVARHDLVVGHHHDAGRVQPRADHLSEQLARHRVAVAGHRHQASARHPRRLLDIAVERHRHRHQVRPFVLEHLGHAELIVLGVADLLPQRPASTRKPCVEFGEAAELDLGRVDPDAPAAVLHVLLDDTLLPAAGNVAEVGLDQVVRAHGREALVDDAALAFLDLVDRSLHVVVNAAPGHAAQCGERPRVSIEQHLMALARVGHQPERPRGAQLHVRDLRPVVNATHHQAFVAPVELVRLTEFEGQRDECIDRSPLTLALAPCPDEVRHPAVAAVVARRLDLGVQRLGRAPLPLGPPRIDLQRLLDRLVENRELVRLFAASVLRRSLDFAVQPLRHRVARQPCDARNLALRLVLAAMQTPDIANHVHGDHSLSPAAQKNSRVGCSPGSVFVRHNLQMWLSFRSAPTPLQPGAVT